MTFKILSFQSFILTLFSNILFAQDFIEYHQRINKADEQIFVNRQLKEGLEVYAEVMDRYDFVFVHDCMNAMQIALYKGEEALFLKFWEAATRNGLMPRHIQYFDYIKVHPLYLKHKEKLIEIYIRNRPGYLRRIDTTTLIKLYNLCANDQINKEYYFDGETRAQYLFRYKKQITATMDKLREIISVKGIPGERLIGLGQNDIDIIRELKIDSWDLIEYFHQYKDVYPIIRKGQFTISEDNMTSSFLYYTILHHYGYIFSDYIFFSDSFYLDQIEKGNLHPKDYANINDIPYDIYETRIPDPNRNEKYFGLRPNRTSDSLRIPDHRINQYRKEFYLPPIEQDRAKWHFLKSHGMRYWWGYTFTRS